MIEKFNKIFEEILSFAERNQVCKRKAVGCAAVNIVDEDTGPLVISMEHNGPSRSDHECTNEVGNCGCSHSEPRIVRNILKTKQDISNIPVVLVCTYSPCTNCANIIIDSGLFVGCVYDILTEHDKRGEEFLRQAMPVLTRNDLNNIVTRNLVNAQIKNWIFSSRC